MGSRQELQAYFETTPVYPLQGRPGEIHRVFVFSAELSAEDETTPCTSPAPLANNTNEVCFAFMKTQTAPGAVIILCDGRSIACRRACEDASQNMRHVHEAWVVYKPTKRLGRRVAYGADNRDTIIVSMPVASTYMKTTDRPEFQGAGEETTHETTYTGVPLAPWGSLPLIARGRKSQITGRVDTPAPSDTIFDASLGMPLFWQERKPPALWKRLLADVKGKSTSRRDQERSPALVWSLASTTPASANMPPMPRGS